MLEHDLEYGYNFEKQFSGKRLFIHLEIRHRIEIYRKIYIIETITYSLYIYIYMTGVTVDRKGRKWKEERGEGARRIFEMVSADLGLICSTFLREGVTSGRLADERRWPVS